MSADQSSGRNKAMYWGGWVMGLLPVGLLLFSASMKLTQNDQVVEGFKAFGFPDGLAIPIGLAELLSTVVYLIPQTAVLGAILLTAYLGGAVVVHVRGSESIVAPILVAVLLWGGLFLRDPRIRALIPFRKAE